jgi:hypothetical protein
VATDCSASIRELLGNGELGIIVPTGDAPALSAAMDRVELLSWDREVMAAKARCFTIEHSAKEYVKEMRKVVARGRMPACDGDGTRKQAMAADPVTAGAAGLKRCVGPLLSAAMAIALLASAKHHGWAETLGAMPRSPLFYLFLVAGYFVLPLSELVIFQRLWAMGIDGLAVLLRKRIANELLLGYSGEAYLYAWARLREPRIVAPFAAVKDVSIASAIAGNAMTLLLLAALWPFAFRMGLGRLAMPALASVMVIIGVSMIPFLLRRRIFSLPATTLAWIAAIHSARLLLTTLFMGLCWHFGINQAAFPLCLLLVTVRMVVGRLPFIPNKDLWFATAALLVAGGNQSISELATAIAFLFLLLDALVLAFLATGNLLMGASLGNDSSTRVAAGRQTRRHDAVVG